MTEEKGDTTAQAMPWRLWTTAARRSADLGVAELAGAMVWAVSLGYCDDEDPREPVRRSGDDEHDLARLAARRLYRELRRRSRTARGTVEAWTIAWGVSGVPAAWRATLPLGEPAAGMAEQIVSDIRLLEADMAALEDELEARWEAREARR